MRLLLDFCSVTTAPKDSPHPQCTKKICESSVKRDVENIISRYVCILRKHESESHSDVPDSLQLHGLHSPWNTPGQNSGVGSLSLLQGIIPTEESNSDFPHYWQILYQLSYKDYPEFFPGEGNGTPLQYSCLENPMDGRAWWAAVHGILKRRTRLSDFTFTFHFHAL
ncbi:hypothetical protein MG293_000900 [Ovis ammon polii]|uniref:Uncharacterized protein n=1 Tax=Ovis ammon polii TaxID=230172 RepID=A0AAD4UR36_OVIAM|nr:hypothetical protein MG293_000900 [Ovis ammon polii]